MRQRSPTYIRVHCTLRAHATVGFSFGATMQGHLPSRLYYPNTPHTVVSSEGKVRITARADGCGMSASRA